MRISDWSSDVCSSDLDFLGGLVALHQRQLHRFVEIGGQRQEARPQLRLTRAELVDVEEIRYHGAARYRFAGNPVMVGIRRNGSAVDALSDSKSVHLRRECGKRGTSIVRRTRPISRRDR